MKAINYYLVVDKIKTEQPKVAGLIITEDLDKDNRYSKGKIVSAGNLEMLYIMTSTLATVYSLKTNFTLL